MISKKRKLFLWTVRGGMYLATALTAGLTLFLMVYVLAKGIPNITWELLSTKPSYLADRIGILPDILNTLYIIIYTLILVLPLGVGAAIYLTEYAHNKRSSRSLSTPPRPFPVFPPSSTALWVCCCFPTIWALPCWQAR